MLYGGLQCESEEDNRHSPIPGNLQGQSLAVTSHPLEGLVGLKGHYPQEPEAVITPMEGVQKPTFCGILPMQPLSESAKVTLGGTTGTVLYPRFSFQTR